MSYMGTGYFGWQIQPDNLTVQELTERALSDILGESISVVGAGRTDTGVHARYYVAHFDSRRGDLANDENLIHRLNGHLPKDIAIASVRRVREDAHARFSAVSRSYMYHINTIKNPFDIGYSWFLKGELCVEAMNEAASLLKAYSDFTSFSKLHSGNKSNICTVSEAVWRRDGIYLVFTITADRFLRNMVRSIVGTLVDVGFGKKSVADFRDIIEAADRSRAGQSAPAMGLYLTNVEYPDNIYY